MNLQEFIDLRTHCPMCGTALITKFDAGRKQKSRLENDRYISVMVMKGMRSCEPDYEVGYSFGLNDNSLAIEFYNEWDMSNHASKYMCDIFKKFHNNVKSGIRWHFARTCGFCFKYEMCSRPVDMNLKAATFSPLEMEDESFVWDIPTDDGHRFILLDNRRNDSDTGEVSELCWWRSDSDYRIEWPVPSNYSIRRDLPRIPFVSKEETGKRLSKLILFS